MLDLGKNNEILQMIGQYKELEAQNLTITKLLEAKIKVRLSLESEKEEKLKYLYFLQNKLNETRNLFDSFMNSLAKTLFEKEFKNKYENFMALQKVYGARVKNFIKHFSKFLN